MGGCRCSYKTCTSITTPGKNLHFFHYPVKNPDICNQWLKNAEKPNFVELSDDQLRNKVVCEYHFEERWFPNCQKKRLLKGAVPTIDGPALGKKPPLPTLHPIGLRDDVTSKINLISANDDATLFVLDTSSIDFSLSPEDVTDNYLYKNGSLLRVKTENDMPEPEKTQEIVFNNTPAAPSNDNIYEDLEIANVDEKPVNVSSKRNKYTIIFSENSQESNDLSTANAAGIPQGKKKVTSKKREALCMTTEQRTNKKIMLESHKLARQCINKVNEHSVEIAHIKRLLAHCKCLRTSSFNKYSALNGIKRFIPPTLFSVVRACITHRSTESDMNFFRKMYEKSPVVYNMLVNDCNWNLPQNNTSTEENN